MDAGRIVTAMTVLLIILFVFMSFVVLLMPIGNKLSLDNLCREEQVLASRDLGLSVEQIEVFKEKLAAIGLTSIKIDCPAEGQLRRYEERVFSVMGTLDCQVPNGFLTFETQRLTYTYEGRLLGRRILN